MHSYIFAINQNRLSTDTASAIAAEDIVATVKPG